MTHHDALVIHRKQHVRTAERVSHDIGHTVKSFGTAAFFLCSIDIAEVLYVHTIVRTPRTG